MISNVEATPVLVVLNLPDPAIPPATAQRRQVRQELNACEKYSPVFFRPWRPLPAGPTTSPGQRDWATRSLSFSDSRLAFRLPNFPIFGPRTLAARLRAVLK